MVINTLLNTLWPSRCFGCSSPTKEAGFCRMCQGTLVPAIDVSCTQCGDVFLDHPGTVPNYRCGSCLRHPPPVIKTFAAFAYGGALRDAIVAWKNEPRAEIGRMLAEIMVSEFKSNAHFELPAETLIIPIPTPFRRALTRGFNPAGQLARSIAEHGGFRCIANGLRLRSNALNTRGLSRQQRLKRAEFKFMAKPSVHRQTILLVDDVRTTGRTLLEAARALKKAGASKVFATVLSAVPNEN